MAKRTFRRVIAKRLVNVAITIVGIMILNFCLIHFMPGNPIENVIPKNPKFDPHIKWDLMRKFHLNDSLPEQLGWYLYQTFTLDWGESYMNKRPVFGIIVNDMKWTMLLVGTSTVLTIILGIAIGSYSAYRRGGAFDVGATSVSLFFYGMPVFWLAIVLQIMFTTHPLGISWWPQLPPGGYYDTRKFSTTPDFSNYKLVISVAKYLILPSLTLAVGTVAGVSLVMRSSLVDTMTDDYIMTAKAKGLTDYQVLRRHALPNGMPPMIALIAMDIAFIIGGAYQVEVIFNYPGIGYRTMSAIFDQDFPILQFIVVIGGVAVVLANFLADMLLLYIDPRIKIS
jgi:peptide/nickel transport system permease protein